MAWDLPWQPQSSGAWWSRSSHLQSKSRRVSGRNHRPSILESLFQFARGYITGSTWEKSWSKELTCFKDRTWSGKGVF